MRNIIIFTILVPILIGGGIWWLSKPPAVTQNYDEFAKCLTQKKLTMYGAAWCPHCQNEKKHFGDSFQYVPYVECPNNPKLCLDKGVKGYPTWIDDKGVKYEGEQGLEKLAQISACQLP